MTISRSSGVSVPRLKKSFWWDSYVPQQHGAPTFESGVFKVNLPDGKYRITRLNSDATVPSVNTFVRIMSGGDEIVNTLTPAIGSARGQLSHYSPSTVVGREGRSYGIGCRLESAMHPDSIYVEGDLEVAVLTSSSGVYVSLLIEEYF